MREGRAQSDGKALAEHQSTNTSSKQARFNWERAVLSERGPASPYTRLVLLVIATHLNRAGEAWPPILQLAAETRLCEKAVRTHLKIAEAQGWISRRSRRGKGQDWRSYIYSISIPAGPEGAAPDTAAFDKGAAPDTAASTLKGAVSEEKGAVAEAEGAVSDDQKVRYGIPINTSYNTSYNKKYNTTGQSKVNGEKSFIEILNSKAEPTATEPDQRTTELDQLAASKGMARGAAESNGHLAARLAAYSHGKFDQCKYSALIGEQEPPEKAINPDPENVSRGAEAVTR